MDRGNLPLWRGSGYRLQRGRTYQWPAFLPFNRSVPGGYGGVFGTFFICGLGEEDFCSLPPDLMERFKSEYAHSEILIGAEGDKLYTLKVSSHPKKPENPPNEKQHHNPER